MQFHGLWETEERRNREICWLAIQQFSISHFFLTLLLTLSLSLFLLPLIRQKKNFCNYHHRRSHQNAFFRPDFLVSSFLHHSFVRSLVFLFSFIIYRLFLRQSVLRLDFFVVSFCLWWPYKCIVTSKLREYADVYRYSAPYFHNVKSKLIYGNDGTHTVHIFFSRLCSFSPDSFGASLFIMWSKLIERFSWLFSHFFTFFHRRIHFDWRKMCEQRNNRKFMNEIDSIMCSNQFHMGHHQIGNRKYFLIFFNSWLKLVKTKH